MHNRALLENPGKKKDSIHFSTTRGVFTSNSMLWNKETVAFAAIGAAIIVSLIATLLYLEQHLPKAHDGNWWIFLVFWALVFISLHVIFYVIIKAFRWFTIRELKPKKLYISPGGDWWLGDNDNTFDEPVQISLPDDFNVEEFQSCAPPPLSVFRGMYRSEIFDSRLFDVMNTDAKKRSKSAGGAEPRVLFIAPSGQFWFGDPIADDAVVIRVPGTFAVAQFYSKEVFVGMYKSKELDQELFPDVADAAEDDDVVAGEGEMVDADDDDDDDEDEDEDAGLVARDGPTTRARGRK